MRILIAGHDTPGALERYFAGGLRALGHEVAILDRFSAIGARLKLVQVPVLSTWERGWHERRYNDTLVRQAHSFRPDILLVVKGIEIHPATLATIKRQGNTTLVNYNPDSPLNPLNTSQKMLDGIPLYDLHLTWGEFMLPHLEKLGARRVAYLPFGYDPAVQYPVALNEAEQGMLGTDVCFVGSWEPQREALLEGLAGYGLGIWGPNWERLPSNSPLHACLRGNEVWELEATKVIVASKIALNFIREQNGDAHNMRTFEIPACGRFMLTTRTREQVGFFGEGEGIACFADRDELREKVDTYLAHPSERETIAKRGHEILQARRHTYQDRMQALLEAVSALA
jgi:glycosyltransferase involved in cell wall biosynthesis